MAARYRAEVWHDGLNKYRVISGASRREAKLKGEAQLAQWNEMYERKLEKEERQRLQDEQRQAKIERENYIQSKMNEAIEINRKISEKEQFFLQYYQSQLKKYAQFDIDDFKILKLFSLDKPIQKDIPAEPHQKSKKYKPRYSIIDLFSKKRRHARQIDSLRKYQSDRLEWQKDMVSVKTENFIKLTAWIKQKKVFYDQQFYFIKKILFIEKQYPNRNPKAVLYLGELSLKSLEMTKDFDTRVQVGYDYEKKTFIVDYLLPDLKIIPKIKEVEYRQNRDETVRYEYSESERHKLYHNYIFQIVISCIYILVKADSLKLIQHIIYNGYVRYVCQKTGQSFTNCVLSLIAHRRRLDEIDFSAVEPEACLKSFKWKSGPFLFDYKPIEPFYSFSKKKYKN